MSDLDALLDAPLGELPAVVTVDVYALALAEIHDARAEIERLHRELGRARTAKAVHAKGIRDAHAEIDRLAAELASARTELATWRSYGTGGAPTELVITRYDGLGDIPQIQEHP